MKLYVDSIEDKTYGHIVFAASDKGLRLVSFGKYRGQVDILEHACKHGFKTEENPDKTARLKKQLEEYFAGNRQRFETDLDLDYLPPFKRNALSTAFLVPFGKVITYGELARQAGSPKAARAAGQAMASNPIPIVIPCHRVVGSDGHLTGYSGGEGIEFKKRLLRLEGLLVDGNRLRID